MPNYGAQNPSQGHPPYRNHPDDVAQYQRAMGPPRPHDPYQMANPQDPNWSPQGMHPPTFYDQNDMLIQQAGISPASPVNIAKDPFLLGSPGYSQGTPNYLRNALLGE